MTLRGRFFWKVLIGHIALVVVVLGVAVFALIDAFINLDAERAAGRRTALTRQIAALVDGRLDQAHKAELRHITSSLGGSATDGVRLTLILTDGTVVADSQGDPDRMDSHADRPEVIAALATGLGERVRWSRTVARELAYTARRVGSQEHPQGVVRAAVAISTFEQQTALLRRLAWSITAVAILAACALAIGLTATWSRRISRLTAAARGLSRGDVGTPLDTSGHDEIALLARSLNRLHERFRAQLDSTERQRLMLESILSRLGEGIVVAEADGRIVLINEAARQMLAVNDADEEDLRRRGEWTVERCIANHDLQQMLIEPQIDEPAAPASRAEIRLEHPDSNRERILLAHVAPLRLAPPGTANRHSREHGPATLGEGRILVITDVTELTQTVKMRTDFVAHASHELRTPLAAIRGAVETLLHMDLVHGDPAAPGFLAMIGRHSRRLEALANDLLALARIEGGPGRFQPAAMNLCVFRNELHDRWRDTAQKAKIGLTIDTQLEDRSVVANPYLLNLVLDNLIDNAIKFTESGGKVTVSIERETTNMMSRSDPTYGSGAKGGVGTTDGLPVSAESAVTSGERATRSTARIDRVETLVVCVQDTGCGIPEREQSRVFERFYQGRLRGGSSAEGGSVRGTGLGLSIVRHAVGAMKGRVELDSTVGRGTTITVRIPQPAHDDDDSPPSTV